MDKMTAVWNPHGVTVLPVPEILLNDGRKIPVIGLGTWQARPGEAQHAVEDAIDVGYRHFDTAFIYDNEEEVGIAIQKKITQGNIKREDLFITSKLAVFMNDPALVREGFQTSMNRLRLEYIDLYLIHAPISVKAEIAKKFGPQGVFSKPGNPAEFFNDANHLLIWKELEKLVDAGLVKSIGLSNFNEAQTQVILDNSRIKPSNLQVECHAYFPQDKLLSFCQKNKIVLSAYAPLGSPGRPDRKAGSILLKEPILASMGKTYGKTPAQLLLRWNIQRGVVVLPKSVSKERLEENFDVLNFQLSKEDIASIDSLRARGSRLFDFSIWQESPNYPF